MRAIAILTSGGDAPGMNSALRALVKLGASLGAEVFGVEQGYEGLMEGRFRLLTARNGTDASVDPEIDRIGSLGGTILGSARSARFRTPEGRAEAARKLAGIDALIVIGGNGSIAGAHALAREHGTQLVALPASIDNDIGCTGLAIGVDTALNTIVDACDRISDTARAHRRGFVVEVMGRDCGYLAMASAVAAGADAVLFREQGRSDEEVVAGVVSLLERSFSSGHKQRVLVIKSEGVKISSTKLVRDVESALGDRLGGIQVRATVLGHLVRGGKPSYHDRMIAQRLAFGALSALRAGKSDVMVGWQSPVAGGEPTPDPYVQAFPIATVLRETEALIDGSSPVTQRRVKMIELVEGVLAL